MKRSQFVNGKPNDANMQGTETCNLKCHKSWNNKITKSGRGPTLFSETFESPRALMDLQKRVEVMTAQAMAVAGEPEGERLRLLA